MAALITWTNEISVGIEEIDEQHKVLIGLLNAINEAVQERRSSMVTAEIITQLIDYTRIHFAVEESLMRILGYQEYEAHKVQHGILIESLADLARKFAAGKVTVGFELQNFLKTWLTKHILANDKKYTQHFLNARVNANLAKHSWISQLWK